jgi:hypothetical protein
MRKLTIALLATAAIMLAGSLSWRAEATTPGSDASLPATAKYFSPVAPLDGTGFVVSTAARVLPANPRRRRPMAHMHEARRIASNIAKIPTLLGGS